MDEKKQPFKLRLPAPNMINAKANTLIEAPARIEGMLAMDGFVGAYTYIRIGSNVGGQTRSIGRYCSIAPGVRIGDGHHPLDWLSTHPFQKGEAYWFTDEPKKAKGLKFPSKKKILIGNDVWIGAGAMIMPGVRIGDGAVVGAGSVVTKDVAPYAIVAGVPAAMIRYRFAPAVIKRLLAARWWNYTASSLSGIPFDNIDQALAEIETRKKAGTLQEINADIYRVTKLSSSIVTDTAERSQILAGYEQSCATTRNNWVVATQPVSRFGRNIKRLLGRFLP